MENRLTLVDEGGNVSAANITEALKKLKTLEDAEERLTARQAEISGILEEMKLEGKQSSYKFKELMGEKLTNGNVISFLKLTGLM